MKKRRGEIFSLIAIGAIAVISVVGVISSLFVNKNVTLRSKASEINVCDSSSKTSFSCTGRAVNECFCDSIKAHDSYFGNDKVYGKYLVCCGDGFWHGTTTKETNCPSDPTCGGVAVAAAAVATSCGGVKTGYGSCSTAGSCVYRTYAPADPHYFNQWIYCCPTDGYWYAKDTNSQDATKGWQSQNDCTQSGGVVAPTAAVAAAATTTTTATTATSTTAGTATSATSTTSSTATQTTTTTSSSDIAQAGTTATSTTTPSQSLLDIVVPPATKSTINDVIQALSYTSISGTVQVTGDTAKYNHISINQRLSDDENESYFIAVDNVSIPTSANSITWTWNNALRGKQYKINATIWEGTSSSGYGVASSNVLAINVPNDSSTPVVLNIDIPKAAPADAIGKDNVGKDLKITGKITVEGTPLKDASVIIENVGGESNVQSMNASSFRTLKTQDWSFTGISGKTYGFQAYMEKKFDDSIMGNLKISSGLKIVSNLTGNVTAEQAEVNLTIDNSDKSCSKRDGKDRCEDDNGSCVYAATCGKCVYSGDPDIARACDVTAKKRPYNVKVWTAGEGATNAYKAIIEYKESNTTFSALNSSVTIRKTGYGYDSPYFEISDIDLSSEIKDSTQCRVLIQDKNSNEIGKSTNFTCSEGASVTINITSKPEQTKCLAPMGYDLTPTMCSAYCPTTSSTNRYYINSSNPSYLFYKETCDNNVSTDVMAEAALKLYCRCPTGPSPVITPPPKCKEDKSLGLNTCAMYCTDTKFSGVGNGKSYYYSKASRAENIFYDTDCNHHPWNDISLKQYCGCDIHKTMKVKFINKCSDPIRLIEWYSWLQTGSVDLKHVNLNSGKESNPIDVSNNGQVGCSPGADVHYDGANWAGKTYRVLPIDCTLPEITVTIGGGAFGFLDCL